MNSASAEDQSRDPRSPTPALAFGPPVIAVISVTDQRISLYDANGGALRAHVSTGKTGLETPSGVYAVLQKEEEHFSNVWDDAAMPFMQRITWSGIALHAGALPGYPASHGCVRMPYDFAERIFPLTRLGMRVVISPDDFAPVAMSHPLLPQPALLGDATAAVAASLSVQRAREAGTSAWQPDLRKSPLRQLQLDALKAIAATKAAELETAKSRAAGLKSRFDLQSARQAKAKKALRSATLVKRWADDQLARAGSALAAAKIPRSAAAEQRAKAKASAASNAASAAIEAAKASLALADENLAEAALDLAGAAPASPREAEVTRIITRKTRARVEAAKAVQAAEQAKRSANDRLADADRALYLASLPRPTRNEEDKKAKAWALVKEANAKAEVAAVEWQSASELFAAASSNLRDAEAAQASAMIAARETMRRTQPVSIFVSLKTSRLYVRQGHEPVADFPVSIADPAKRLGTHVFTAAGYENNEQALRWIAVSVGRHAAASKPSGRRSQNPVTAPPTEISAASAALDRIQFPPELARVLDGYVWPGSSLIVSDEELSKETGLATDFVVVMSGEPQGGLIPRQRDAEMPPRRRSYASTYEKRPRPHTKFYSISAFDF